MRKITLLLVVFGASGGLAGCVGDTGNATDVRATQATLMAFGHTNNGPAYWWWEWGTTRKAVTNGQGTKTPKQGPASSPDTVTLTHKITGLDRSQAYYFRACGQDQAAGSPVMCGTVRHFGTPQGDSTISIVGDHISYVGDPAATHILVLDHDNGPIDRPRVTELDISGTSPPAGSTFIPGNGCSAYPADNHQGYDGVAICSPTSYIQLALGGNDDEVDAPNSPEPVNATMGGGKDKFYGSSTQGLVVRMGSGDDYFTTGTGGAPAQVYGDDGDDELRTADGEDNVHGGKGNDEIHGGAGVDSLYGEDGNDVIWGGPGLDGVDCGLGDDTVHVSSFDEFMNKTVDCEDFVVDDPA